VPPPATHAALSSATAEPGRLARADRRQALLDAALSLVTAGDAEAVSIESVADRAGVSRPLVYRHFANRRDILAELYRREGDRLHEELSADVSHARTLVEKYRALFRGSIRAAAVRGPVFEALRAAAETSAQGREVQRERDRQTRAYYSRRATSEYGIRRQDAETLTAMLLSAIAPALSRWHANPTNDHAVRLEEVYLSLVTAGLEALAGDTTAARSRPRSG
jgi:AcrR family transcriptional regulator